MAKLEPIKASLVADLVDFINENLADLLVAHPDTCHVCNGRGVIGGETRPDGTIFDDGTLATCATCGGVGAVERYTVDMEKLKTERFGRYVEGFEVKQGQLVPKMRSKDRAFAMLIKLLGLDKAVVELQNAGTFAATLTDDERERYKAQLMELVSNGLV